MTDERKEDKWKKNEHHAITDAIEEHIFVVEIHSEDQENMAKVFYNEWRENIDRFKFGSRRSKKGCTVATGKHCFWLYNKHTIVYTNLSTTKSHGFPTKSWTNVNLCE